MNNQATQNAGAGVAATRAKIVESDDLLAKMRDIYDAVARRAYDLFEQRGREEGHDLDDWLYAEAELIRRVPIEVTDRGARVNVTAEVSGYTEENIEVGFEPRRVLISGRKRELADKTGDRAASSEFFCVVDLPVEVEPAKATVLLRHGMLDITLPKAALAV